MVPNSVYSELDAGIKSYCASQGGCMATVDGDCWLLDSHTEGPRAFPVVSMRFNDVVLPWPPQAYLYQRGLTNKWCKSYAANGNVVSTVLGATWMQGKDVIFDLQ